jgi:hypothetical protein
LFQLIRVGDDDLFHPVLKTRANEKVVIVASIRT